MKHSYFGFWQKKLTFWKFLYIQLNWTLEHYQILASVPWVQKIKIRNLTLDRLLIIEFSKKMVYLGAHYSERQGLMG